MNVLDLMHGRTINNPYEGIADRVKKRRQNNNVNVLKELLNDIINIDCRKKNESSCIKGRLFELFCGLIIFNIHIFNREKESKDYVKLEIGDIGADDGIDLILEKINNSNSFETLMNGGNDKFFIQCKCQKKKTTKDDLSKFESAILRQKQNVSWNNRDFTDIDIYKSLFFTASYFTKNCNIKHKNKWNKKELQGLIDNFDDNHNWIIPYGVIFGLMELNIKFNSNKQIKKFKSWMKCKTITAGWYDSCSWTQNNLKSTISISKNSDFKNKKNYQKRGKYSQNYINNLKKTIINLKKL